MASLTIVAADDAAIVGTVVPLQTPILTIGREPDNALVLTDPLMSRHHARIRTGERGLVIEDLGSSNGVQVNGQRVVERDLVPGDRIQIGRTVLVLEATTVVAARCPSCRGELDADARFCPACGGPVQQAPVPAAPAVHSAPRLVAPAAQPAPQPAPRPPSTNRAGPRRRWPLYLALGIGLVLVGAGGGVLLLHLRRPSIAAGPSPAPAALAPELEAAVRFRADAVAGWHETIRRVATPDAARQLAAIGEVIWPDPHQAAGWVYLLETALLCPGAHTKDQRPVAFYHPFSDVFLITVWARVDGDHRLVDVELLMGDFVRKKGKPTFETGRPAAHQALYLPLSVGLRTAETIRAYETAFGGARSGGVGADWRAAIPALRDEELLQVNRVGAGLQIAANMGPLGLLALPSPTARGTRQVRAALKQLLQAVRSGQAEAALARGQVLKETREMLARLPFEQWERFKPVSYTMGSSRSLLLLSRSDQTDRYLALLFAHDASVARLERVDLFSFNVFYRDHATLRRRVGL